ncbi:MAG: MmcQ/YjbR family DNA-binding protein [Cyanobacteria bacterium]|nr:MmcQ/YjbR family DNA-binding protein [Cyanobacteriota bacterium]
MTPAQFRKIVLGFDGAVEASHMKHPDFRAPNGKIFATLTEQEDRACVMLTPDQQAGFLKDAPGVFEPAAGAWGRGGSTMIALAADAEMVGEALTLAWRNKSVSSSARRPARKRR